MILHVPILGQLLPAQLPLSDALEPGPLEEVGFGAPLAGAAREQPPEGPPRYPDDAVVLAALGPELHGLLAF